jgi:hypothetical protein
MLSSQLLQALDIALISGCNHRFLGTVDERRGAWAISAGGSTLHLDRPGGEDV